MVAGTEFEYRQVRRTVGITLEVTKMSDFKVLSSEDGGRSPHQRSILNVSELVTVQNGHEATTGCKQMKGGNVE